MRRYETTYIIDGTLEDDKITELANRVKEMVSKTGGEIVDEKHWGKRRLAYEINKRQYGYYIILDYQSPPEFINELERFFRLNQFILRYLTIQLTPKILKKRAIDAERKRIEEVKALEFAQSMNKSKE